MSMFLAGFADSLARDLKENRTAALDEQAKIREQERRQKWLSEERSLDRADKIRDKNLDLELEDSRDYKSIQEVTLPGGGVGYTRTKRSISPDGKIQITAESVTDPSTLSLYKQYKQEQAAKLDADATKAENDRINLEIDRKKLGYMDAEFAAEIAAKNRVGKGSSSGEEGEGSFWKSVPEANKSLITSIALGDTTYLRDDNNAQIEASVLNKPLGGTLRIPFKASGAGSDSLKTLARRVQEGDKDAYKALLPYLNKWSKVAAQK